VRFFRWVKWRLFAWGVVHHHDRGLVRLAEILIPIRPVNEWVDWDSIEWDFNGRR